MEDLRLNLMQERRIARDMSQADVAKIAGITRSYYSEIETGKRVPSLDIAIRIGNAVGVVIDPLGLFSHIGGMK